MRPSRSLRSTRALGADHARGPAHRPVVVQGGAGVGDGLGGAGAARAAGAHQAEARDQARQPEAGGGRRGSHGAHLSRDPSAAPPGRAPAIGGRDQLSIAPSWNPLPDRVHPLRDEGIGVLGHGIAADGGAGVGHPGELLPEEGAVGVAGIDADGAGEHAVAALGGGADQLGVGAGLGGEVEATGDGVGAVAELGRAAGHDDALVDVGEGRLHGLDHQHRHRVADRVAPAAGDGLGALHQGLPQASQFWRMRCPSLLSRAARGAPMGVPPDSWK